MKKIFIAFLSIFLFSCQKDTNTNISNDKVLTQKAYYVMLKDISLQYDLILNQTKPNNLSLSEYKIALISGKIGLSLSQQSKILNATQPLIEYATNLSKKNSLKIENLDSKIALGGLYSPNDDLNSKYNVNSFQATTESGMIKSNSFDQKQILKTNLESREVFDCALAALGADALWALGGSAAATWSAAAITTAFSAIAKRALGPVGVAIAVITFGLCISHELND